MKQRTSSAERARWISLFAKAPADVAGRDKRHAELAAVFDALMQSDAGGRVREVVLQPIEAALAERHASDLAQAQATRVEFMTMARGEDA